MSNSPAKQEPSKFGVSKFEASESNQAESSYKYDNKSMLAKKLGAGTEKSFSGISAVNLPQGVNSMLFKNIGPSGIDAGDSLASKTHTIESEGYLANDDVRSLQEGEAYSGK